MYINIGSGIARIMKWLEVELDLDIQNLPLATPHVNRYLIIIYFTVIFHTITGINYFFTLFD